MSTNTKLITSEELELHNQSHSQPWLVIDGKVYTIEEYQYEHPGGDEILLEFAGRDATVDFKKTGHSKDAIRKLKTIFVGDYITSK